MNTITFDSIRKLTWFIPAGYSEIILEIICRVPLAICRWHHVGAAMWGAVGQVEIACLFYPIPLIGIACMHKVETIGKWGENTFDATSHPISPSRQYVKIAGTLYRYVCDVQLLVKSSSWPWLKYISLALQNKNCIIRRSVWSSICCANQQLIRPYTKRSAQLKWVMCKYIIRPN